MAPTATPHMKNLNDRPLSPRLGAAGDDGAPALKVAGLTKRFRRR